MEAFSLKQKCEQLDVIIEQQAKLLDRCRKALEKIVKMEQDWFQTVVFPEGEKEGEHTTDTGKVAEELLADLTEAGIGKETNGRPQDRS